MAIVPYSGQVSYNDIRSQFGSPGNFNLQSAYNGSYGTLNNYSYIQPTNPGGANYSPNQWYGYVGDYIYSSNLVTVWDAWPTIGSYPGSGTTITDTSGDFPPHNGGLYNGTSWSNSNGGWWVFDGIDDYIAGFSAYWTFGNEITVDVWIKWDVAINYGQGVGQGVFNNYDNYGDNMWLMHGNGGGQQTLTIYAWDNTYSLVGGATTSYLTTGNWYNLIGVISAAGSYMYTNGSLTGTGGGFGGNNMNVTPSSCLFGGGDVRYDFRRMGGAIAAIHIYNTAFNQAQVNQNFNALRGRFSI